MSILVSIGAASTAASTTNWSLWQEHHWGSKRGGSGSEIGGIGPEDEVPYTMGLCALMDHEGCCHLMAAMGPCSQRQSIQQSANILCNSSTLLKLEFFIIINVYSTI
jgi:hypothetical protein